jgi:uncharacterized protein (DUF1330 family)
MTAHAIVTLTVTSPDNFAAYREQAGAALAKHGGTALQSSPNPILLEGEGPLPQIAVVLAFPDRESAQAWKNDPELAAVHALRMASGNIQIILL